MDYVTKPINTTELLARMEVHLTNARLARSARNALDTAGQNLFAVDASGQLLWTTPRVASHLPDSSLAEASAFTSQLSQWLQRQPEPGHSLPLTVKGAERSVEFLALVDNREYLLRLREVQSQNAAAASLKERFQLTSRESDVLLWIANGKTNREIGQILDMSPRTVNKHLEQVFRKLGVENRTAAAAAAIRFLATR